METIQFTNKITIADNKDNCLELNTHNDNNIIYAVLRISHNGQYNGIMFSHFDIDELEKLRDSINECIKELKD